MSALLQLLPLIKLLGPYLTTALPLIKQLVALFKSGKGNVDMAAVLALLAQILALFMPTPTPTPGPGPTPGPTPVFASAPDVESAIIAEATASGCSAADVQELINAVK